MIYGKQEFVKTLADKSGISQKAASEALEAVLDTIVELCAKGDTVNLTGFGKFDAPVRAAREGTNPATGEKISIPEKRAPRFKAGKAFKDAVEGGQMI